MMANAMLSLLSNPYDPFTQYDEWKRFDRQEGFDTDGFFDRLLSLSEAMTDEEIEEAEHRVIDNVLQNPSFAGLYKKVEAPS